MLNGQYDAKHGPMQKIVTSAKNLALVVFWNLFPN